MHQDTEVKWVVKVVMLTLNSQSSQCQSLAFWFEGASSRNGIKLVKYLQRGNR